MEFVFATCGRGDFLMWTDFKIYQGDLLQKTKSSNPSRFVVGSFPRPLPPNTSTLNPPSATKINNIIGRSMEQLVVKF